MVFVNGFSSRVIDSFVHDVGITNAYLDGMRGVLYLSYRYWDEVIGENDVAVLIE